MYALLPILLFLPLPLLLLPLLLQPFSVAAAVVGSGYTSQQQQQHKAVQLRQQQQQQPLQRRKEPVTQGHIGHKFKMQGAKGHHTASAAVAQVCSA
jgi:hypothetical protein